MPHRHHTHQPATPKAPPSPYVEVTFVFRDTLQKPIEGLSVQIAAAEPLANSNAVVESKTNGGNTAAPVLGFTVRQVGSSVRRRGFTAYETARRDDALLAWLSLPRGRKAASVDDGAALEGDACEKAVDDAVGALAFELSGVGREV